MSGIPSPAPSSEVIAKAAMILRAGGLVAVPTETVYGLAANAADAEAVARLYAAKGRPRFNPLIAHVADLDEAAKLIHLTPEAQALASTFWPGALSLVGDIQPGCTVCDLARAGLDTLAVRVPAHPLAQALLQAFGQPFVAPSANPSGQISPTRADHVARDMADKIDMILDGGACTLGLESTILDVRKSQPVLLRPGAIARSDIEDIAGPLLSAGQAFDTPSSPGQLARHYAPQARLRLNAKTARIDEAYLGFGPMAEATLNLSQSGNLTEAAANLFWMLRALDQKFSAIAVAPIPYSQLGEAINDRLARAAKPL